jgi:hypothetical protein
MNDSSSDSWRADPRVPRRPMLRESHAGDRSDRSCEVSGATSLDTRGLAPAMQQRQPGSNVNISRTRSRSASATCCSRSAATPR